MLPRVQDDPKLVKIWASYDSAAKSAKDLIESQRGLNLRVILPSAGTFAQIKQLKYEINFCMKN